MRRLLHFRNFAVRHVAKLWVSFIPNGRVRYYGVLVSARPCHANASVNVWNIYIAIRCRLLPLFLLYGSLTLNWPQDYIRISFLIPFSLVWFGLIFDSSCPPLPLIHTHARFALSLSFIFLPSHLVRALPCALSIKNTRKNFPYFSYRTKFASNFSFSLHHFEHLYECNASKARGINFQWVIARNTK